MLEVTSRYSTRDRFVDVTKPPAGAAREDAAILKKYLEATELIPTDGIVRKTAYEITRGKSTDVDKARAIYEWIVDNTLPRSQDARLRRGRHQGDARDRRPRRQVRRPQRALRRPGPRGRTCRRATSTACACAESSSATRASARQPANITKAQHCRAEVFLTGYGWVPVDPADVRKVVLEEKPAADTLADPARAAGARASCSARWEMNWLAYNDAHDVSCRLERAGGRLPHVPAGGDRQGAPRQPRPGQFQVHDHVEGELPADRARGGLSC